MTYVRNRWYAAAWSHEIGRELTARTIMDEKVVMYRTEDGKPVVLEDRCCHKYLPLSMGTLKGDCVECGYHGMTFDGSGACVRIPGQPRIPENAYVRAYPTVDHLGMVWIWPGDPALAREDKLFSLPPYGAPGWTVNRGPYTYIRSNYLNITDNLLDPAHVSFVHLSTLGSPTMADIPVDTNVHGESVCVSRWTPNQPPVPILRRFLSGDDPVDRWQYYWFHAPSICVTDFGCGPVGMDRSDEARDAQMRIHSCHFLTPETERSTHYFWMQIRNFAPNDESVSATMTDQLVLAFDEDKQVLEGVQAGFDAEPPRPPVKLAIDNGPNRGRRIVDRLIREEQGRMAAE